MKKFWIRWYHLPTFSSFVLLNPYWKTGWRVYDDCAIFCGAFRAKDREGAVKKLLDSYDKFPHLLCIDILEEKPDDWSPFSERRTKAAWMMW